MKKSLTILILGVAFAAAAIDDGFKPYQTIPERMPFGRPSATFDPNDPATPLASEDDDAVESEDSVDQAELEKIAEYIRATVRVCALNVLPDGTTVVGFTDGAYTPARNRLLAQGQSADGWTVLEIDVAARSVVLEREGVAVNLTLGGYRSEAKVLEHRVPESKPKQKKAKSSASRKQAKRSVKPRKPKSRTFSPA